MVQMIFAEGKVDKPKEVQQMDSLKEEIKKLNETIAALKQNQERDIFIQQVKLLQEQNKALQENYNFILRKLLENGKTEEKKEQFSERIMHIDVVQLLTLLHKAGALNPMFAIQASDMKVKFGLQCTDKTLRNKFNEMCANGLVSFSGLKPKRYYLSEQGMNLLKKERQSMLQVYNEPIAVSTNTLV